MEKIWAAVPAAGMGHRMRAGVKKQFLPLNGKEMIVYTLEALSASPLIEGIVLASSPSDITLCEDLIEKYHLDKVQKVIPGGRSRAESVFKALEAFPEDVTLAVIHDGARPLVTKEEIAGTIEKARQTGAAVLAVPVTDTIKVADAQNVVVDTPERRTLWAAQTPQVFSCPLILEAYRRAFLLGDDLCTDDSQVVEKYTDSKVSLVQGSCENLKLTNPEDMQRALFILEQRKEVKASR